MACYFSQSRYLIFFSDLILSPFAVRPRALVISRFPAEHCLRGVPARFRRRLSALFDAAYGPLRGPRKIAVGVIRKRE